MLPFIVDFAVFLEEFKLGNLYIWGGFTPRAETRDNGWWTGGYFWNLFQAELVGFGFFSQNVNGSAGGCLLERY